MHTPLTIVPEYIKMGCQQLMNRTKGFVNLNRFKSGRAIKQLNKARYDQPKRRMDRKKEAEKEIIRR